MVRYTLVGYHKFPLHMLKKQECWPAGKEDEEEVVFSLNDRVRLNSTRPFRIKVEGFKQPNKEEWMEAGYKVE